MMLYCYYCYSASSLLLLWWWSLSSQYVLNITKLVYEDVIILVVVEFLFFVWLVMCDEWWDNAGDDDDDDDEVGAKEHLLMVRHWDKGEPLVCTCVWVLLDLPEDDDTTVRFLVKQQPLPPPLGSIMLPIQNQIQKLPKI